MMARQRMQGGVRANRASSPYNARERARLRTTIGPISAIHGARTPSCGAREAAAMVLRHGASAHPDPDRHPAPAAPDAAGRVVEGAQPMRFGGLFRERSFYQSRAARGAYRGLRRGFAKAGFDIVVKTFYLPIPDLEQLPPGTFERRAELPRVAWDLDRQLAYVQRLREQLAEFRAPGASGRAVGARAGAEARAGAGQGAPAGGTRARRPGATAPRGARSAAAGARRAWWLGPGGAGRWCGRGGEGRVPQCERMQHA